MTEFVGVVPNNELSARLFDATPIGNSKSPVSIAKAPVIDISVISDNASETSSEEIVTSYGVTTVTNHFTTHVRSELHREAVHMRQDLQQHLRHVMQTGDEMLLRIREVVEKYDEAEHRRRLAVEQCHDAQQQREEIRTQLTKVLSESVKLKKTLYDMVKERDHAHIELEIVRGEKLEQEAMVIELRKELVILERTRETLTARVVSLTAVATEARTNAHKYEVAMKHAEKERDILRRDYDKLDIEFKRVDKDLQELTGHHRVIVQELEKERAGLKIATRELTLVKKECELAVEDRRKAESARDEAVGEAERAEEGRSVAVGERDDALNARNDALSELESTKRSLSLVSAAETRAIQSYEDTKRTLVSVRQLLEHTERERNEARTSAEQSDHHRDEMVEAFQQVDHQRHLLLREKQTLIKKVEQAHGEKLRIETVVEEYKHNHTLVVKEKELVQIRLMETQSAINSAVVKEAKALEDLAKAQEDRRTAGAAKEDMEDRAQGFERERDVKIEELKTAQVSETKHRIEAENLGYKLKAVESAKADAAKERDALAEKLRLAEEAEKRAASDAAGLKAKLDATEKARAGLYDNLRSDTEARVKVDQELKKVKAEKAEAESTFTKARQSLEAANTKLTDTYQPTGGFERDGLFIRAVYYGGKPIAADARIDERNNKNGPLVYEALWLAARKGTHYDITNKQMGGDARMGTTKAALVVYQHGAEGRLRYAFGVEVGTDVREGKAQHLEFDKFVK